jgi:hypothetical protein
LKTIFLFLFLPLNALACACGCGIFDIGTYSVFPGSDITTVSIGWDYLNQSQNWNGSHSAGAAFNDDKDIRTHLINLGAQKMFNRNWGAKIDLPFEIREYVTTGDAASGALGSFNHAAFGDVKIRGMYTGMLSDMTLGLNFGLKLPTGDHTFSGFDPDTEIGNGSTDLLLGIYKLGSFGNNFLWQWFTEISLDQPVLTQNGYIPGAEIDAVFGAYYDGLNFSDRVRFAPILQILATSRASDRGGNPATDPINSGYERLMVGPAFELTYGDFRFYASVQLPFYQYTDGEELVAPTLIKTVLSYNF